MFRVIVRRWKLLAPLVCLYVALLAYYANRTMILARANETAAAKLRVVAAPSSEPNWLKALRKEQERLKSDIQAITELQKTLAGLTNEVAAAEKQNSETWFARSSELQVAIEQARTALQETIQWSRDWERRKIFEAAENRLAEKAALNLDPVKEQERIGKILSEIARSTRERMKLHDSWRMSSDKSNEAREKFMTDLQKINAGWLKATGELGADTPLYEEIPIGIDEPNKTEAIFFRSVIPDLQGMSVTVLLDGTVKWSEVR
ncbi:MAG TPA: hypothetical protein VF773_02220 [Verrucomicrobiae bacterium]